MFKKLLRYGKKSSEKEKKESKKTIAKKAAPKKEEKIQYSRNKLLTAEGWLRRQQKSV